MINPGTLVLTTEGYYGIVLGVPTSHGYVDIFVCNGLHVMEHEDDLKPLGLKHDSADAGPPAFFGEIIQESIRDQAQR